MAWSFVNICSSKTIYKSSTIIQLNKENTLGAPVYICIQFSVDLYFCTARSWYLKFYYIFYVSLNMNCLICCPANPNEWFQVTNCVGQWKYPRVEAASLSQCWDWTLYRQPPGNKFPRNSLYRTASKASPAAKYSVQRMGDCYAKWHFNSILLGLKFLNESNGK